MKIETALINWRHAFDAALSASWMLQHADLYAQYYYQCMLTGRPARTFEDWAKNVQGKDLSKLRNGFTNPHKLTVDSLE